ncbi:MAG: CDP-alcohol phosphatidyltransferase family protein [Lachnospiraceae bacterium]|nr:CDP-alcohol phosphatidyltransferase family protein [Lachnospiraceae bacterium]
MKKIIPSRLETGLQKLLYRTVGARIPAQVTPNQITFAGALGGLAGIICAALSMWNRWFLAGTICGLACHLICDDLDGYVARTRKMTSRAGGYFDLLTDIVHITYLIIALAFAGVIQFWTAIFMVPVYALLMFTAMNYILHLDEFLFPRLGPIETHLFFAVICVAGIACRASWETALGFSWTLADLILLSGGALMYCEMIRLQIQLFRRLSACDKKAGNGTAFSEGRCRDEER